MQILKLQRPKDNKFIPKYRSDSWLTSNFKVFTKINVKQFANFIYQSNFQSYRYLCLEKFKNGIVNNLKIKIQVVQTVGTQQIIKKYTFKRIYYYKKGGTISTDAAELKSLVILLFNIDNMLLYEINDSVWCLIILVNSEIIVKFEMTSNKVEIDFMITKLLEWNEKLGGSKGKKSSASSQFDILQEEFLSLRHKVEKYQDIREKEGINVANAHIGQGIRDGIDQMRHLLGKLQQEQRRLIKRKKDTPQILERRSKIVRNCQELFKDIEDRQNGDVPRNRYKTTTLTDMKAKLLKDIQDNTDKIHGTGSDGQLSQMNQEEDKHIKIWKKNEEQQDVIVDEITAQLKNLNRKAKNINEMQDIIQQKQQPIDKKMDGLTKRIKKDNDQLKTIIQKFKPNRCCLFIALFLLFAGLIVVIIKILI